MSEPLGAADEAVLDLAAHHVPPGVTVIAPSPVVVDGLCTRGVEARRADLTAASREGPAAALALLGGELSSAGEHAEALLSAAAARLRGGGLLLAAAPNRIHRLATGAAETSRAWSAEELVRSVGHPGIAVELVFAPGAAALLRGEHPEADLDLDRVPGLLDAGPHTLVIGRRPGDAEGRSAAFFASVPRKVIAAAVLCRDATGRLLLVHDSFRGHWTIPGGVVDADEDPRTGALREAYEEAGVRASAGALLGVFAMPWPDRLLLVYEAAPADNSAAEPAPVHTHEIDAARWVPLDGALKVLNRRTASQVRRCLEHPGETWADPA